MKIGTGKPRTLIPAGEHLLFLQSATLKTMQNKFKGSGADADEVERLIWQFISKTKDPDTGEGYEFAVFTGLKYGNTKAAMTKLLDNISPGITVETADTLDTDDLCGKWYRARIKHSKDQSGNPKAEYTMLEPYSAKPATKAPAPPDDPKDPFPDS